MMYKCLKCHTEIPYTCRQIERGKEKVIKQKIANNNEYVQEEYNPKLMTFNIKSAKIIY